MRLCISLSVSGEGMGPGCCLSCYATISRDEAHDRSPSWESLLASRLVQSANFRYCWMVMLAALASREVHGILDVCFWDPDPSRHMIWGTEVAVSSGKRFTVLCPAAHRAVLYFRSAVSPDNSNSNSHCSFEMSFQIWCASWCLADLPRISSMRLLRIRRCLVAVAKDMPCEAGGSPCFNDLMSRRWSHAASLCQTLPTVSSQDRASASRVISALDVQSHSCVALFRFFFMIWQATSSVFIHLSTWAWRVWAMKDSVVVYPMPPISFGVAHG
jgi:hypothetical protein